MFKYVVISISTLGLFSATTIPARAEFSKTPAPLTVVSNVKTPVLVNVCGNGIVEAGEACDGGENCSADCEGGVYHAEPPAEGGSWQPHAGGKLEVGLANKPGALSPATPAEDGPGYQAHPAAKPEYAPVNPGQGPGLELDPLDKPEISPLPGPAQCGNGVLESGEACDDGNGISGDGCGGNCLLEVPGQPGPLVDKTPKEAPDGEDSAVGFGGQPWLSGSGCSLQAGHGQPRELAALLAMALFFAIPALRRKRGRG